MENARTIAIDRLHSHLSSFCSGEDFNLEGFSLIDLYIRSDGSAEYWFDLFGSSDFPGITVSRATNGVLTIRGV